MNAKRMFVLIPALILGTSAVGDAATSFSGSCWVYSRPGNYKVSEFAIRVEGAQSPPQQQMMRFSVTDEQGSRTDFVADAWLDRRSGSNSTGLGVSPVGHREMTFVSKASSGATLLSRYMVDYYRIECKGSVEEL